MYVCIMKNCEELCARERACGLICFNLSSSDKTARASHFDALNFLGRASAAIVRNSAQRFFNLLLPRRFKL